MRVLALVLLLVMCPVAACAAEAPDSSEVRLGVTFVQWTAEGGDSDTQMDVWLTVAHSSECDRRQAGLWGSDPELGRARTMVKRMRVSYGGDSVSVPERAVIDLSEPHSLRVATTGKDYRIIIEGGDASTSYIVTFTVSGTCIIRRRVESGEFPDEVWEETTFPCWPHSERNDRP